MLATHRLYFGEWLHGWSPHVLLQKQSPRRLQSDWTTEQQPCVHRRHCKTWTLLLFATQRPQYPQSPPTSSIIHVFGSSIFNNVEQCMTFFSLQFIIRFSYFKGLPPITPRFHWLTYEVQRRLFTYTAIPQLTSEPANEIFRLNKIFFRSFFWTRLTNMDSANECFSWSAR